MKQQQKTYFICNKCGNKQQPIRRNEEGVKDWNIYDNVKCKCGGTFKFKII